MKEQQKKKEVIEQNMKECSFFSIAVDSSLVKNEHLLSCFVRFSFLERTLQLPLFFAICPHSTGSGVAHFIFNKLVERLSPFEKLVSVCTDGATNMIDGNMGMTTCLKRLIQQHRATQQIQFNDFHSVWCFAHRLNLTTKDFLEMKGVNFIKTFADWFSDKRRQVLYKTFLSRETPNEKLKKIPQPSDTRWLFYRDVIASILSQRKRVEKFVNSQECFTVFCNSLKSKEDKFGTIVKGEFSFSNGLISSLFLFVDYVLGVLGNDNAFLQQQCLNVWDAWCAVQ